MIAWIPSAIVCVSSALDCCACIGFSWTASGSRTRRGTGAVAAGDLFRLVLDDPQFAWLRSLSALIARIDAAIDAEDALGSHDVDAAFREVYRLLKGGEGGDFRVKYHEALQRSPDVVMAHAAVSKLFLPSPR